MNEFTKRSFTSGEISPSLRARNDLNKFQSALATCINFICLPEGGAVNRPGFQFIGADKKSSLIPFQFNQNDSYILAFSDGFLTIYRSGLKVHSVSSPYSYEDMTTAQFVQNADVITIAHIDHPLTTLTRFDHDEWVFNNVSFSATQEAPKGLTVKTVGTDSESNSKQYDYVITSVVDGKESGQSEEASITTSALSETWGNQLSWEGEGDSFNIFKSVSPSTNVVDPGSMLPPVAASYQVMLEPVMVTSSRSFKSIEQKSWLAVPVGAAGSATLVVTASLVSLSQDDTVLLA